MTPNLAPVLLAVLPLLAATAMAAPTPPHHDVRVEIDPARHRLDAVDRISLPAGGPQAFRLAPQLGVTRLDVDGRSIEPSPASGLWRLPPGAREVTVHYGGTFPPAAADGDRHTAADAAAIGPEGSFLPSWAGWLPDFGNDRITYRLTVSVPEPHVAVGTGDLAAEERENGRYRASFSSPRPAESPSLFAGPYRVFERAGQPLLRAYLHPELTEALGREHLELTAKVIGRFAETVGPYPFGAFHILSAPLPVGLGFPGLTYIDRRILPLPFIRAQSLPHEILHNWWGNGVVPDYGRGNWAEGLTTYMADYGLSEPEQQRSMRLNWLRDYAALPAERDMLVTAFHSKDHDAAQVVGYNKVAFIFHMLRSEIGEQAFGAGIRRFWGMHAHTVAGWSDWRRAFEQAAGRDLGTFFRQWLERPGAPTLRLAQASAEQDQSGRWRTTVRITQDEPAYDLKVPLLIETEGGPEHVALDIAGGDAGATYLTAARPTVVAVDPGHDLFRRLAPGEAPPTLRDVTLAQRAGVVVAARAEAARTAQALAERLLDNDGQTVAPEKAATHDGPLLVIGTRDRVGALLPGLGLTAWGSGPSSEGTARAWVARRRAGPALVVEANDPAALAALLRPLPHYGRESFVVLDGSKVIAKGVWETAENPLRRPIAGRKTD